jgi:hypothetical protein
VVIVPARRVQRLQWQRSLMGSNEARLLGVHLTVHSPLSFFYLVQYDLRWHCHG